MNRLVTPWGQFQSLLRENEEPLEKAIVEQAGNIFGPKRFYLDCKRRIGSKDGKKSIPDAFLLDFTRKKEPGLWVVENEIAQHDLFKHIGVQMLQFAVSFRADGHKVKSVLVEEISAKPALKKACEEYARDAGLRNLDFLLEHLVFKTAFQAVIIIDQINDQLSEIVKQFQFPVELIEFKTFVNEKKQPIYEFEPFLDELDESLEMAAGAVDPSDFDTIVVPAQEDGFKKVFLGENRWYAIRLNQNMIPQIKYIAAYQVAPVSAITHYAEVKKIERWQDTSKYILYFSSKAATIGPLVNKSGKSGKMTFQGPRYAKREKMLKAKTLQEVFG